jgi:hypothetical protein
MRRLFTMSAVAAALAALVGLQAYAQQDPTTTTTQDQTKIKTDHAKEMTFTGCLQTGTADKTYILDKLVPARTSEVVGTSGSVRTVTKYELIPSATVQLQEHVGHKVEVTGVEVPAGEGDATIKTETKLPGAKEHSEMKIARSDTPQFRVISIKHLSDTCSN